MLRVRGGSDRWWPKLSSEVPYDDRGGPVLTGHSRSDHGCPPPLYRIALPFGPLLRMVIFTCPVSPPTAWIEKSTEFDVPGLSKISCGATVSGKSGAGEVPPPLPAPSLPPELPLPAHPARRQIVSNELENRRRCIFADACCAA